MVTVEGAPDDVTDVVELVDTCELPVPEVVEVGVNTSLFNHYSIHSVSASWHRKTNASCTSQLCKIEQWSNLTTILRKFPPVYFSTFGPHLRYHAKGLFGNDPFKGSFNK